MKFFVGFLFVAVFTSAAVSASIGEPSKQSLQQGLQPSSGAENMESLRFRKAAYGPPHGAPAAVPALALSGIPCPKNYLFSCQPQLQPVACGGQSGGAAAAPAFAQGAYSEFIPQWAPYPQEM